MQGGEKYTSPNWLLLCMTILFCVPAQPASLHPHLNMRPVDERRNFIYRNPFVRVFGGCPGAAVDVTNDYMFKGVFKDPARMRDFLSQLLLGDGKIFSADTELLDISFTSNEYIQDAPTAAAKKILCDIVVNTNKGQVVIEMQKNCYPKEDYIKRMGFYASSLHVSQEILGTGRTPMKDYQNVDRVILISVVGSDNNLFERDVPCVSYHSFRESTTLKRLIHPIDFVIIELKKFIDKDEKPQNYLEEWIWLLAYNDIDYEYTDEHIRSAVQRIKVVMRDEYFNYQRSLREERARDISLFSAIQEIKEKDEEIKKKDDQINSITMTAIRALSPTPDNKEAIALKLNCSILMVENVMKQMSRKRFHEDFEGEDSGG